MLHNRAIIIMAMGLSAIAGLVDSCTFYGLFGLFVAQLTGSYVAISALGTINAWPVVSIVFAAPVFFLAGMLTTFLALSAEAKGYPVFIATLLLEILFLIGFALAMIIGIPSSISSINTFVTIALGLSAMGVQSALVRLLMPGVGSTNVMTTNTSQVAVDAAQVLASWWQREDKEAFEAKRQRLLQSALLPISFLAGAVAGTFIYSFIKVWAAVVPVVITSILALWALRTEMNIQGSDYGPNPNRAR